jgi:BirA family biotin operon repressor/biotin-[acetyl-CoA-carboxylase] ligase
MNTAVVILEKFLNAKGDAVSGAELARAQGVSRVSVWGRLQQLREEGFEFEASTRVGYRLVKTPGKIHGALLEAWLRQFVVAGSPVARVHALASVDSTNEEAARRLGAGEAAPFLVVASAQTQGRGRRGRVWESGDAGNLYMSFAVMPLFAPEKVQGVTLAIGLRLCVRLAERYHLPLQIKWPNDLMCGGRKIAGILAEARMDSDQVREIVFGLGLKVNSRLEDFPAELRSKAGSLAHASGTVLEINETAALCAATVFETFERFLTDGAGSDFRALWEQHDFLAGKKVVASGGGREVSGAVLGLDATGALLVRDGAGVVHALNSGEVTLARVPRASRLPPPPDMFPSLRPPLPCPP